MRKLIMEVSLNELKKQADDLGITYSPNIGEATLLEKIQKAKIAKGIIDARAKAKDERCIFARLFSLILLYFLRSGLLIILRTRSL